MADITVLDQNTINQIAAGEVIERPASVVKELMENAIDAKASAITVEIKDGGISMIRVTDNGYGISADQIPLAFLRHSTSKIRSVEDLITVSSLGFRGEALSSIAAVSQVELITKTANSLTGARYRIEGGEEIGLEEVGAPEGTTFISRNLFYNTPARKKFLKSPGTEGAHVADLVEKIALSHPEVSIRLIQNNQNKLHTSGNHNLKDMVYTVFGREIAGNLLPVEVVKDVIKVSGFVGKPVIARGNRNYENYYINGRYIKSTLIAKAIEEAYKPFMMQHKYPFTLLHLTIDPTFLDVNVHPTKMELRFRDGELIFKTIFEEISKALSQKELIPQINLEAEIKKEGMTFQAAKYREQPEPFETKRMAAMVKETGVYSRKADKPHAIQPELDSFFNQIAPEKTFAQKERILPETLKADRSHDIMPVCKPEPPQPEIQLDLFDDKLLSSKARQKHQMIGQLFDTYWLVEYQDNLYIIDQHAAHEKVLYEKTIGSLKNREYTSQLVNPPIILTLSTNEEILLNRYIDHFTSIGFEIEHFGGKEYAVRGVPDNLFSIAKKELLMEMIDGLSDELTKGSSDMINERIASMSCKAAVKGRHRLSIAEANQLIDQLLELENPYACPHGRPTIISMSKYELEKKFKRVL